MDSTQIRGFEALPNEVLSIRHVDLVGTQLTHGAAPIRYIVIFHHEECLDLCFSFT